MRRLALAIAFSFIALASSSARADTTTTKTAPDPNCTIGSEQENGTTCVECTSTAQSCADKLGPDFHYVCSHDKTIDVWCDGPTRTDIPSYSPNACALGGPALPGGGAMLAAAAVGLALGLRRRVTKR